MEDEVSTSNINFKWLDLIYQQLENIQSMERMASEGCTNLVEYVEMPLDMRQIIIADARYKNLRFMANELRLLIDNLKPVLNGKRDEYFARLLPVLQNIDKRHLFLREVRKNNQVGYLEVLDMMGRTHEYLSMIKADLINEIGDVLFIKNEDNNKKKW